MRCRAEIGRRENGATYVLVFRGTRFLTAALVTIGRRFDRTDLHQRVVPYRHITRWRPSKVSGKAARPT